MIAGLMTLISVCLSHTHTHTHSLLCDGRYKNPNEGAQETGARSSNSKSGAAAAAAVVLPRMRPNFAFIHTLEDYNAATMMCRALGIIALETQCSERHCPVFDYILKQCVVPMPSPSLPPSLPPSLSSA